ncbi:MAG: hypothetical protein WDZ45_06660 [Flavobacteriaceae bacterium]
MKETIDFKKQRELGAIITDAFKFIRLEGKELGSLILKITGPALLAVIFSYVYYTQSTLGNFENILIQEDFSTDMILSVFLLMGSVVVFYALIYCTVLLYIKSYIANQGTVQIDTVSREIKDYFWGMLGLNLLIAVIVAVGFLFCVLPGIYLMVCLTLAYPILIFERNSIGDAISNSFKLIKDEWWNTFATFIVIYILYSIVTLIFQIPQLLYFFIKGFAMSNEVSANPFDIIDWVSITLDVIAMVAGYLLFTFILIAIAFVYFHLNEKKNFTGTLENIDKLGSREL